jgi:hypothetical protein
MIRWVFGLRSRFRSSDYDSFGLGSGVVRPDATGEGGFLFLWGLISIGGFGRRELDRPTAAADGDLIDFAGMVLD